MVPNKTGTSDTGQRTPQWIEVTKLLLDPENFRLPEHADKQEELLRILDKHFRLIEIGQSIADNGYFSEEPLSAVKDPSGSYIVVEGNRRLAALKLLLNAKDRTVTSDPDEWNDLATRVKHDISKVPVLVYSSRDELTTFLGYRHIAGILKWQPLQKAAFLNTLVEAEGKNANFEKIRRRIGVRFATLRDYYIAYRILLQARDRFDIDTSAFEKKFSVFVRALSTQPITRFIGLNKDKTPYDLRLPVPVSKRDELEELIGYVYGTRDVDAVLTDSRKLDDLGEVLDKPKARRILRGTRDLPGAHALVPGGGQRLIDNLALADFYLDESVRDVHHYRDDKEVAEIVNRCASTMNEILRHFPKPKTEVAE